MQSNKRRNDCGVLRTGSEDRLVAAIRHHQALRDRELWRQEIHANRKKPKANGKPRLHRGDGDGFAAAITRIEFGRFYFRQAPAPKGKPTKRGK